MHDAAAHEETGGQAPAAVQEEQVGNQCYHLTPHFNLHQEEVDGEPVDPQVVERLHFAYRLLQFSPHFGCEDNVSTQAWRARSCSYGPVVAGINVVFLALLSGTRGHATKTIPFF